ncbi:MAG: CoA pyrophosphatase [Rhodospirillales bacterium]
MTIIKTPGAAIDLHRIRSCFSGHSPRLLLEGRGDKDLNPDIATAAPLTSAAVLIPLIERPRGLTVLFTRRTDTLSVHAGQISFPGGRVEAVDIAPEDTALRETEEEVGLTRDSIDILGRLDDYITRTNFIIAPFVATIKSPFELTLDPREVTEAFEVPLTFFLDAANHQRHVRIEHGKERHVYAMPYQDYYIWGITAGMLFNLYEFLGERDIETLC